MPPGSDLFVVCKQCGAEVSPYITECPYCGNRIRKRAPKLPKERSARRPSRPRTKRRSPLQLKRMPSPSLGRMRRGEMPGIRAEARPYATIAIILASAGLWIAWRGGVVNPGKLVVAGPLHGEWWRLLTHQFIYGSGLGPELYGFVALSAVAIFGSLLEQRHGPIVVAAIFLGAGVTGALVTLAIYSLGVVSGAAAGALALLCAWAVPDLLAARAGEDYDGDLIAVAVIACVLLVMPFALPNVIWLGGARTLLALPETSWIAGVTGALFGLLVGVGLVRIRSESI